MQGRDVVLGAETGSGKTLAFLVPVFHRFDHKRSVLPLRIVTNYNSGGLNPDCSTYRSI